jgi:hypothetical protein
MEQGDMFGFTEEYSGEDAITCNKCGVTQPASQFQVMASGEIKRMCNTCRRNHSALVNELKIQNDYPDKNYSCPICDRHMDEISLHGQTKLQKWVLDHCHDTKTFRGWLCHHCNSGLGSFKDNTQHLERAVAYLKRHRDASSS